MSREYEYNFPSPLAFVGLLLERLSTPTRQLSRMGLVETGHISRILGFGHVSTAEIHTLILCETYNSRFPALVQSQDFPSLHPD
jgi:hypothetical protein